MSSHVHMQCYSHARSRPLYSCYDKQANLPGVLRFPQFGYSVRFTQMSNRPPFNFFLFSLSPSVANGCLAGVYRRGASACRSFTPKSALTLFFSHSSRFHQPPHGRNRSRRGAHAQVSRQPKKSVNLKVQHLSLTHSLTAFPNTHEMNHGSMVLSAQAWSPSLLRFQNRGGGRNHGNIERLGMEPLVQMSSEPEENYINLPQLHQITEIHISLPTRPSACTKHGDPLIHSNDCYLRE